MRHSQTALLKRARAADLATLDVQELMPWPKRPEAYSFRRQGVEHSTPQVGNLAARRPSAQT